MKTMNSPQQGFVCHVFFEVTGSRDGVTFTIPGDVAFSEPSGTFTPYDQLTEEQVASWIQSGMHPDRYASLLESVDAAIDYELNPPEVPKVTPLPWVAG
jgi:outer membrane protease